MEPKTLQQAIVYFADPKNCREYLVARRWPDGVTCPGAAVITCYLWRSTTAGIAVRSQGGGYTTLAARDYIHETVNHLEGNNYLD